MRVVLLLAAVLCATVPSRAAEPDVVEAAMATIQARLPGDLDPAGLDRAAVEGMTRWLDQVAGAPGNAVLSEAAFRAHEDRLRGRRFGLGIEFSVAGGRGLLVTAVRPGTPAARAGVQAGDLVVAMDDRAFTGLSGAAIAALAAEQGGQGDGPTALDLRREDDALRRLLISPASFEAPAARVTRNDDHLLVQVELLGQGIAGLLRQALRSEAPEAVVIDLRDVHEGDLEATQELAGVFVPPGQPLFLRTDPGGRPVTLQAAEGSRWKGRLVVLVNRGSAGPAEALAGALRSQAGAVVVGTRTAGAATVPSFHPLGDGLILQLADIALCAPDGSSWAGEGLLPDLVVEPLLVPVVGPVRAPPPDIQLDAALRFVGAR